MGPSSPWREWLSGLCAFALASTLACASPDEGASATDPLPSLIHVDPTGPAELSAETTSARFPTLGEALAAIDAEEGEPWVGTITMTNARHEIVETAHLRAGVSMIVSPGATLALGEGVSIVHDGELLALGLDDLPITYTWADEGQPWGSVVIRGHDNHGAFESCRFEHASETQYEGGSYRGALSVAEASVEVRRCAFVDNTGDDGLSVALAVATVTDTVFERNHDGVDLDGTPSGLIEDCRFEDQSNDAIDLGEAAIATIRGNEIHGSGDKGVSIGERSDPTIEHNVITGCGVGIAIKDSSDPWVAHNTIVGNEVGLASFEAVLGAGGGAGQVSNSIIWGSAQADVMLLNESTTTLRYCCTEDSVEGEGNISPGTGCDDPSFADPEAEDFHLMSTAGRFDAGTGDFVDDADTSPCIDAGDPEADHQLETSPHGERANLGAHGNTPEASRSP